MTINGEDSNSNDGNDDDDAEMDNDSVSFLMAPSSTAAVQNEDKEEANSATIEDLRQTISLREQQVKSSRS